MKKAMTRMRPELANLLIFSQLLKRVPLNPHFVCISTKEKREKWANNGQEREKKGGRMKQSCGKINSTLFTSASTVGLPKYCVDRGSTENDSFQMGANRMKMEGYF